MRIEELNNTSHRRLNPLTREWVLVSPNRADRPWQGHIDETGSSTIPAYDPQCYLCPGNERASGTRNPQYESTFVFRNDFASLQPEVPDIFDDDCGRGLIVAESEPGICKVVCFSPRHDLTLARMRVEEIAAVVDVWMHESRGLGALPYINYVQIFENRGEIMGCSNPHPHCQVWANRTIPNEPRKEQESQLAYQQLHKTCLLCDYLELERKAATRIVCENDSFLALVPFWAIWPFEILLVSKQHTGDLLSFSTAEGFDLADILRQTTIRYDNLFRISFPYSMGLHPAPTDGEPHSEWHFHAHFYPPLLRSATVRKFFVGYEMLAAPQRDITPEFAAARLRAIGDLHWADR